MTSTASTAQRLLEAAATVFAAKGYGAASVQEVADAVGIRKPSVYKHFGSKEHLLLGNLALGHEHREAVIAEISDLDAAPVDRLREYLRRYVVRTLEHPELTVVFSRQWEHLSEPHRSADLHRRRRHRHLLRDLVEACRRGGDTHPDLDPRLAATYLRGAVNATPEWFRDAGPRSIHDVAATFADLGVGLVRAAGPVPHEPDGPAAGLGPLGRGVRMRALRNRRDAIDDASLRIFRAKGFAAATVGDVAAEVGVLKGSMYHYIAAKDELLVRLFETAHLELTTLVGTVAQLDATPAGQMRELVRLQVLWFLENPDQAVVVFREWPYLTGEHRDVVVGRRRDLERFLRRLLESARRDGELAAALDGVDLGMVLRFVLGAVNAVSAWYVPEGPDDPGHLAEVYAALTAGLLRGRRDG